jgi:hypothetical protein
MSAALDRVHTARLLDYARKTIEHSLQAFTGEVDTPATRAQIANQINEMYASMGLAGHYTATCEPSFDLVEQPIVEALPPETDGTIQMGEGDGPEIITGHQVTKVVRPGNDLVVNIKPKHPAEFINLQVGFIEP